MTFTKERQKKTLAALMAALLAIGGTFMSAPQAFAASNATQTKDPQPAYIKADVTIIKDGEILNDQVLSSNFESSPIVKDNILVVGSRDGGIYRFHVE